MSRWWKTFWGTVICACIVAALFSIIPKALAYTVCSDSQADPGAAKSYACAPITAHHAHRRFKHGKMGNNHGNMLPRKLRHKLDHKYGRPAHGRFSVDDWWNGAMSNHSCWFGGKNPWDCTRQGAGLLGALLTKEMRHTTHVFMRCGGEGVIGKYAYKVISAGGVEETEAGWYGVGGYTTACLIGHVWDKWWP